MFYDIASFCSAFKGLRARVEKYNVSWNSFLFGWNENGGRYFRSAFISYFFLNLFWSIRSFYIFVKNDIILCLMRRMVNSLILWHTSKYGVAFGTYWEVFSFSIRLQNGGRLLVRIPNVRPTMPFVDRCTWFFLYYVKDTRVLVP